MAAGSSFRERLLHEVEPICIHFACAVAIEAAILVFGLGIFGLKNLFPDETAIFWWMEKTDLFAMLTVVVLFLVSFVVQIGCRVIEISTTSISKAAATVKGTKKTSPAPLHVPTPVVPVPKEEPNI